MIIDNVDDEGTVAAVMDLLARLRGGRVLINGRITNYPGAIRKLELGVLKIDDSIDFLLKRTDDDRAHDADEIKFACDLAIELGGLPLGLEQAGAYISVERVSFRHYLSLWKEHRKMVLDWFDRDLMTYDHDTGLAATWATSVDRLKVDSRRLLERLAYFSPEPIPDVLLLDLPQLGLGAPGAISGLYAYSLVSRVRGQDVRALDPSFVVHRLVQDFTLRSMEEGRRQTALDEALAWMDINFTGDSQEVHTWAKLDPLAPHALNIAKWGYQAGYTEPTARLYTTLGVLFLAKAQYYEAQTMNRVALMLSEDDYGKNHPAVAVALNNLAGSLCKDHQYEEAESMLRRALAIDENYYGKRNSELITDLTNLASVLRGRNKREEAEALCRRAIAIGRRARSKYFPSVAGCMSNLAVLLAESKRHEEAEVFLRRALAINERVDGHRDPEVATIICLLAAVFSETGRREDAEKMYRAALEVHEESYGPIHPIVATNLNNLAVVSKDADESEKLFRRTLSICEACHGNRHPEVAVSLWNLAVLLDNAQRHDEAKQLFCRAGAIDDELGGENEVHGLKSLKLARTVP